MPAGERGLKWSGMGDETRGEQTIKWGELEEEAVGILGEKLRSLGTDGRTSNTGNLVSA